MIDYEQPKCVICNKHTKGRAFDRKHDLKPCCKECQSSFESREWNRLREENKARGII